MAPGKCGRKQLNRAGGAEEGPWLGMLLRLGKSASRPGPMNKKCIFQTEGIHRSSRGVFDRLVFLLLRLRLWNAWDAGFGKSVFSEALPKLPVGGLILAVLRRRHFCLFTGASPYFAGHRVARGRRFPAASCTCPLPGNPMPGDSNYFVPQLVSL